MTQTKILKAKAFLEAAGFRNAVFTGDEKKPAAPMVVPNKLFEDMWVPAQPSLQGPAPGSFLPSPPPRLATPWDLLLDESVRAKNEPLRAAIAKVWREEMKHLADVRLTAEYSDDGNARRRELADAAQSEQRTKSLLWTMVKESLGLSDDIKSPGIQDYAARGMPSVYEVAPLPPAEAHALLLNRAGNEGWRSLIKVWCKEHPDSWTEMAQTHAQMPSQGVVLSGGALRLAKPSSDAFDRLRVEVEHELLSERVSLVTLKPLPAAPAL